MINLIFIIKAILIGIVEGITEFIPVSSTGHMIIIGNLIGFKDGVIPSYLYTKEYIDTFEVVIQLGAILAIVVLYWDKIKNSLKNFSPKKPKSGFRFWFNIFIGSIPAGVLGILFHDKIKEKLFNPITVTAALLVGAFWMLYAEKKYRKKYKTRYIEDVNLKQAFLIGCFQCLALWPGMSRSASTIIGAWICGLSTVAAAEFSFFLALPAMVGASGISLLKADIINFNLIQVIALTIGFIVSFVVALIVVDGFISFLKKKPMRIFAMYRILIGIILSILIITKII
ncbi:undecaprenyl-diphosphate phosphatase [Clostridium aestuarii]|uniref:Undecaprenyl-diphosphatase n=1 Tax=Clostridium aestuarii TaxID=338193 RepID=A0ABT4D1T0_9CLOT|nr:undecaprenyl-diphosphate phosphatase [Clostridium aestuarii]MCY6485201.1 undecaprenyl-diphosphate phosphatase [Clostridium aestuarii]